MKQQLLLVAALMLSASVNAFAQGWEKPTYATQEIITDGETPQYLLNVGAGAFALGANDWETRASVSTTKGFQWKITSTGMTSAGEVTYSLIDYVEKFKDWRKMFVGGVNDIWVDNNNGANCDTWTITVGENNTFKIGNTAFPDATLGVAEVYNGETGNTRLYLSTDTLISSTNAFWDVWVSVSVEAYEGYAAEMTRYEAALDLKAAIDAAKDKYADLDLADEEAVYNNTESTLEQLQAAKASVTAKLEARDKAEAEANASLENPRDLSNLIVNATFDKMDDFSGWSGSGFGAGGTKSYCAERYNMNYDTWQEIKNLPNGVYRVNVDGFYRAGSTAEDYAATVAGTNNLAKVYAQNIAEADTLGSESALMHLFTGLVPGVDSLGGTTLVTEEGTFWAPNSMKDFTTFNDAGYYKTNSVLVAVSEGVIRLGVKKSSTINIDWTIVDNFGLTYYGKGADAFGALAADYKANATLEEGINCTVSLKEEYDALVATIAATNYEEYHACVVAVNSMKAAIAENIALWKEYADVVAQGKAIAEDPAYSGVADDLAWAVEEAVGALEELELSSEDLVEAIADLKELIEDVKTRTPWDTDVTKFIVNNDFAQGWTGWSHSGDGGNVAANAAAKCAEAWNSANFDIHQDIENAPVGMYEIQVQGFYRYGRGDNAWNAYFNEDGTPRADKPEIPAFVYLNDAKTPMANVFEYQVPFAENYYTGDFYVDKDSAYTYPNNMADAGLAFDHDAYKVSAFGLVGEKGDVMRIGMKGSTNQLGDSWAIFTRFKLIYRGTNPDYVKPMLEEKLPTIDIDAIAETITFEGQFIGKDVADSLVAIKAEGEAALESENGNDMFAALAKVLACGEKIETSIALFQELNEKYEYFVVETISNAEDPRGNVLTEAEEFCNALQQALDASSLTDAEATEALKTIARLTSMLAIPASIEEASAENPVDLTMAIANPSFELGSTSGWTQTGTITFNQQNNTAFGKEGDYYAERWHVNGTLDMHQDLYIPAGYYELSVLAHCSTGDGVVYAGGQEVAITNDYDATNPETVKVVFHVADEAVATTIGVKATLTASTWTCVDNFKLLYSGSEPLAIETIENKSAVKTQIFDLSGKAEATLQQGVNIVRQIDAQGNVKTFKVIIK